MIDIAINILVAAIDAVQFLLQVLVDELVSVQKLIQTVHGGTAHVITVTKHINIIHLPKMDYFFL